MEFREKFLGFKTQFDSSFDLYIFGNVIMHLASKITPSTPFTISIPELHRF